VRGADVEDKDISSSLVPTFPTRCPIFVSMPLLCGLAGGSRVAPDLRVECGIQVMGIEEDQLRLENRGFSILLLPFGLHLDRLHQ